MRESVAGRDVWLLCTYPCQCAAHEELESIHIRMLATAARWWCELRGYRRVGADTRAVPLFRYMQNKNKKPDCLREVTY
jgi:hypothetical protein